ncbi:MAG: SDR family oxidoreductase [Nanoarchaeota archaeon]
MRLKGKVALVTGSSRGIGKAIALLFSQEGASVVVNYAKDEKGAKQDVDEIQKKGGKTLLVQADVADEKQVKAMVEKTVKEFGKIDVLVNNAGLVYDKPLFEKTVEEWRRTLDVNLIGMFLCAKYAAPHMPKGSAMVNISSTCGINSTAPTSADYDASKAGVINLTRNLASELAPNIRVNNIAPGWIDTDMNKDLPKDYVEQEKKRIPSHQFAKPEEIATIALFLSTPDSSFVNSQTIVADGGYR